MFRTFFKVRLSVSITTRIDCSRRAVLYWWCVWYPRSNCPFNIHADVREDIAEIADISTSIRAYPWQIIRTSADILVQLSASPRTSFIRFRTHTFTKRADILVKTRARTVRPGYAETYGFVLFKSRFSMYSFFLISFFSILVFFLFWSP